MLAFVSCRTGDTFALPVQSLEVGWSCAGQTHLHIGMAGIAMNVLVVFTTTRIANQNRVVQTQSSILSPEAR